MRQPEPAVAGAAAGGGRRLERERGSPMTEAELASYPARRSVDPGRLERGRHRPRLPQRGRRRPQAAARRSATRVDAGADSVAVVAPQNQPAVGQIVDRDEVREAAQSRVEVTQSVLARVRHRGRGRGHGPRPAARPRRRRPRLQARRGPALGAVRDPLRAPAPRPGRVGQGQLRGARRPTSRCASTTTPCAGTSPTRSSSRTQTVNSPELIERLKKRAAREAAPLHVHLPALGRREPRGGLSSASPRRSPSSTATTSTRPASR